MNVPTMTPFAKGVSKAKALAAAALAATMLVGSAAFVTAPRSVYAEDAADASNTNSTAGLCTPTTGTMGDSSGDINATDTGVATYVGGDMFVGKRTGDDAMKNADGENGGGPDGSYAAEIEGATVVNGDLYTKLKKGFFTAGVVAFGSQFVPAQDTQVLTVGGNTSTTAKPSSDSHAFSWKDSEAPALSNLSRSVVGVSDNNKLKADGTATTDYTAAIAGSKYNLYGKDKDDTYSSVVAYSGKTDRVNWGASNPLSDIKGLDNGADDSSAEKTDFTKYGEYLKKLSTQMKDYKGTSEMTVDTTGTLGNVDPNDSSSSKYTRYKYNWNKNEASYKFEFDNNLNEKLITFRGDGKSALQVFTISADDLKTGNGQTGISYKFENIPDNTSVVINVTGTSVDFHNGWRFLWQAPGEDKPTDLSNGYWNPGADGTETQKKAYKEYAERASKILWNFADATNVTIRGGQASGKMTVQNRTNGWGDADLATDDDPAAAMMGSILVPNGNFESHVSTNGRVWVGGDFSMYNPTAVHTPNKVNDKFVNNAGQKSASVIDMDQERHNLPWSGNYTSQCASLEWSKVDAANNTTLLAGSSWAIYTSKENAKNGTNPLKLVTDNEPAVDLNGTPGIIKVGGLNTNATYYVKEIGAPQDYEPSDTIYMVKSGAQGTTVTISQDADGKTVEGGKIPNEKRGTSLTWKKTKEDGTTALAGSAWTLTKKADGTTGSQDESWAVKDNTVAANGLNIYRSSDTTQSNPLTDLTMNMNETVQLTTKVTPKDALQKVVWSSETKDYKNILRIDLNEDGTSTAYAIGAGTVVAKACTVSEANGNGNNVAPVCSTIAVTVTANVAEVTDFSVKHGNTELTNGGNIDLRAGKTAQLTVTATAADGNAVTPTYASSDDAIATVSDTGLITAVADGMATITVTAGNQSRTFTVTVTSTDPVQYTYIYFPASGEGVWGAADMWVHYGTGNDWKDSGHMTAASCDGNWKVARIPRVTTDNVNFGFQHSGDGKAWYGKQGGGDFTFPANAEAVTVSGGTMKTGYPSTYCSSVRPTAFGGGIGSQTRLLRTVRANDGNIVLANDTKVRNGNDSQVANDGATVLVNDTDDESGESDDAVAGTVAPGETSDEADAQPDEETAKIGASRTAATPATLDDVDSDAGEFKVIDLDDGAYWLTERTAPDGYTVNKAVYKVTIAGGNVNWEGGWPSIEDANNGINWNADLKPTGTGNAISDTPTEVTWYKIDSTDKDPSTTTKFLTGAQWELTLKAADSSGTDTVYCIVDGNGDGASKDGKLICPKPGADVSGSGDAESVKRLPDVSKTATDDGHVVDEADGIIKLTGLKFGTYELIETVAPEGYNLSTTKYTFTIDQNSSDGATVQISFTKSDGTSQNVTGNRIPNKPGVEMPDTGGIGTSVFLIGGTLAVLVATLGLAEVRRRRS